MPNHCVCFTSAGNSHAAGLEHHFDVCVDGLDAESLRLPGKPDPALFSCQALSAAGAESFRVSPSLRFGILIIPKKQKQEQNMGCNLKATRQMARDESN